ncbi:MAG TPA: di-trans,poly-cis-decaprenylcistransferase [Micromonosporaceae bacterium]|nr:di-trans,poly-cis-decaprenylcistransferase [Micromonosporaceae bacterium]
MTSVRGGLPGHVACIMDGNGRWATRRELERIDGHAAGEEAILATVDAAINLGLRWLTLFAFSTENWNRPEAEVSFLMAFNHGVIARHGGYFHSRGVRVRYMGSPDPRIPADLRRDMSSLEDLTRANSGMTLTLSFNFGGRAEIVDAVNQLLRCGDTGQTLTEELFTGLLQYPDMPDVDLLIRTSGEYRLSNFMLWRMAYAELLFTDVLWPDFRGVHLRSAVGAYSVRRRRFGSVPSVTSSAGP